MKPLNLCRALLIAASLSLPLTLARAADVKSYQVTDTTITVQKGDEKWQLARSKTTKGGAAVKVGDKVTVYYQMVATEVEVKGDQPAKKDK